MKTLNYHTITEPSSWPSEHNCNQLNALCLMFISVFVQLKTRRKVKFVYLNSVENMFMSQSEKLWVKRNLTNLTLTLRRRPMKFCRDKAALSRRNFVGRLKVDKRCMVKGVIGCYGNGGLKVVIRWIFAADFQRGEYIFNECGWFS